MELSRTIETETGEMIVKRVSVPLGLEELMEGLAKEVILKKPKDIYIFAADYFSRLLRLRNSGLYRGNVRSAKLAVRRPFRATVIGQKVLSESKDTTKTKQRKTPPEKIVDDTNNTNENRRAIIQNHLRKKQDAEAKQKQLQMQNTKSATLRSKLPTRSRSLSKSSTDKSGNNSESGEADKNSIRKSSSGKEDIIKQKQTRISPRSRSTSESSSTRELKEKKRMEAIKEKNSNICGTEKLNKKNVTKCSSADVEIIGESESRNIRRSLSVTQDKNGHYEVLYRPIPLPTGQRESTNVVPEQSNNTINSNQAPVDVPAVSDQNEGMEQQTETTPINDEVKSAIAIQALWRGRQDRKKIKRQLAGDIENNTLLNKFSNQQKQSDDSHHSENNSSTSVHQNGNEEYKKNDAENENSIISSENTEKNKEASDAQSKDFEKKLSVSDYTESIQNLQIETRDKLNEESDIVEGERKSNDHTEEEEDPNNETGQSVDINHTQVVEYHQNPDKKEIEEDQDEINEKSKTKVQEDENDKKEKHYHRSDTIEVSSEVSPKEIDVSDKDTLLDVNSSAFHEDDSSDLSGSVSLKSKTSVEEENAKNSDHQIPDSNVTSVEKNEEPIESPRKKESIQISEESQVDEESRASIDTHTKEGEDDKIGLQKESSPTESPKQTYTIVSQINNAVAHEGATIMSGDSSLHPETSIGKENTENSSNENDNISLHTNKAITEKTEESEIIGSQEKNNQVIQTNEENGELDKAMNQQNDNIPRDEGRENIDFKSLLSEEKNEEIERSPPSTRKLMQIDDSLGLQSHDNIRSQIAAPIEDTYENIVNRDNALEIQESRNEKDMKKSEFKKKRSQSHKLPQSESVEGKSYGNLRKVHSEDYEKLESRTKRSIPDPGIVSSFENDEQIGYDTVDQSAPQMTSDTKLDKTSIEEDDTGKEDVDGEQSKSIATNGENQRIENEIENDIGRVETEMKNTEDNSNIADISKDDYIENAQLEESAESLKEQSEKNPTEMNVSKDERHKIDDIIVKDEDIENIQFEESLDAIRNSTPNRYESSDKSNSNTESVPLSSEFDNDEGENNIEKASGEKSNHCPEKGTSGHSNKGKELTDNMSKHLESNENYGNENETQSKIVDYSDDKVNQVSENNIESTEKSLIVKENLPAEFKNSELGSNAHSLDLSPENESKSSHESIIVQENLQKSNISNIGCVPISSDHVANIPKDTVKEETKQKQSEGSNNSNSENSKEKNIDEGIEKMIDLESDENNELNAINQSEQIESENSKHNSVQSPAIDDESLTSQKSDVSGTSSVGEESKIVEEEKKEKETENEEVCESENSNGKDENEERMLTTETPTETPTEKSNISEFGDHNYSDSVDGSLRNDEKNRKEVPNNSKNHLDTSERESAIRIQTIWRGFQARKHLKLLLEQKTKDLDPHYKLMKKHSSDSIKDENENLPETKNNNLTGANRRISNDDANNIVTENESTESSETPKLQNGGIPTSDEIAAAVKIQSAFRRSKRQRRCFESGSISKQDINESTTNGKEMEVNCEKNREDKDKIIGDTNKKLENYNDTQSSQSEELRGADTYTNEEISAAKKIQSTFRKSRKLANSEQEDNKKKSDTSIDTSKEDKEELQTPEKSLETLDSMKAENFTADEIKAATKIQSTFRKSRRQRLKPKLEDMDLNSDLGKQYLREVLKIQSAWRAYRVRKNIRDVEKKIESMENLCGSHFKKSIHLTDQEILKAVTKIQAGLRGYLTRKHFNNIRDRNEALDGIKEESQSDYSRTNSNSSTDEQLLEMLKKMDGAIIPDTVPEIPPHEDSTSPEKSEEGNKKGILNLHHSKTESGEDLESTGKNRMKREIDIQNSHSTDSSSQDFDNDKNTNKDQQKIRRDNEMSPVQSLKDNNSEDGKHLQQSKQEQEIETDTKLHLTSIKTSLDDEAFSREITSHGSAELKRAINNTDGISAKEKTVSEPQLKHDSEGKDVRHSNEALGTDEMQSTDKRRFSEGSEQQLKKSGSNTPKKTPYNEESSEEIIGISEEPNKGSSSEDSEQHSEKNESNTPIKTLSNGKENKEISEKPGKQEVVQPLSSMSVMTDHATESELDNTVPKKVLYNKDEKPSDDCETSERDLVGSYRGTLKKTKAIDNLVELAEQFEEHHESPEEKQDSKGEVNLEGESEDNNTDINIDDVEPGKKLASFEIPDGFEPDSLEVERTFKNSDIGNSIHIADGKQSREISATNSIQSSERISDDELTPRSEQPPSTKTKIDVADSDQSLGKISNDELTPKSEEPPSTKTEIDVADSNQSLGKISDDELMPSSEEPPSTKTEIHVADSVQSLGRRSDDELTPKSEEPPSTKTDIDVADSNQSLGKRSDDKLTPKSEELPSTKTEIDEANSVQSLERMSDDELSPKSEELPSTKTESDEDNSVQSSGIIRDDELMSRSEEPASTKTEIDEANSVQSSGIIRDDELISRSEEPPSTKTEIDAADTDETKRQSSSTSNEEVNGRTEGSLHDEETDDHTYTLVDKSGNAKEHFRGTTETTNIKDKKIIKSDISPNVQDNRNTKPTLTDFMRKTLDLEQSISPDKKIGHIEGNEKTTVSNETVPKVPKRSRYESATKIQSIFRGYQARKFVESIRASRDSTKSGKNPDISNVNGDIKHSNENAATSTIIAPEMHESLHGNGGSLLEGSNMQGTQTNNVDTEANGNVNVEGSQVPAGVENLTTEIQRATDVDEAPGDVGNDAQTSISDANTQDTLSNKPGVESECEMESTKRNNSTLRNKNMEAEAATKIQAGFRGYKVRKQLKMKNTSEENTKKSVRRKSSSCLTENQAKKQKENIDLQEKSAVKIQAGIRGFLVRKRVKKPKKSQE